MSTPPCLATKTHIVNVFDRDAPEVPFLSPTEFLELQRLFVREYTALIHEVFVKKFEVPQGCSSLTWTDRDMIMHGVGTFPELTHRGAAVIRIATKGHGVAWSVLMGSWLADMVTTGCRSTARALVTWPKNNKTLLDIYSRTLRQEMVTTMYDNLRIFDQVYDNSFVSIRSDDGQVERTYTKQFWREVQLAFCMITHWRLGPWSSLDTDVVRCILDVNVLHNAMADHVPITW